jgi:hypothetical protein
MQLTQQNPHIFNKVNVEAITPTLNGCYGLFCVGGPWVFIGKGGLRAKLLAHLGGDNTCITQAKPTHWAEVVTDDMDNVELGLIAELRPICNVEFD